MTDIDLEHRTKQEIFDIMAERLNELKQQLAVAMGAAPYQTRKVAEALRDIMDEETIGVRVNKDDLIRELVNALWLVEVGEILKRSHREAINRALDRASAAGYRP